MVDFLRILLFAKTVLLTAEPVDMIGEVDLIPDKPLSAITSGARLEIDVSSMISFSREQEDIPAFRERVQQAFPPGSIEAKLITANNSEVLLHYRGGSSYAGDSVHLILTADSNVPIKTDFTKVVITSQTELQSVAVYWRNHKY